MKRGMKLWRDLLGYVKQGAVCDDPFVRELEKMADMAAKYERLRKHYPNILARLTAKADEREQGEREN